MQSPVRMSYALPSSHVSPEPERIQSVSSASPCTCAGVAIWPRSTRRFSTSSQCAIPTRGNLRNGCAQSRRATFDRVFRTLTSFSPCPYLRVVDEPAQLVEEDAGGCALALEGLDPVEPGQ